MEKQSPGKFGAVRGYAAGGVISGLKTMLGMEKQPEQQPSRAQMNAERLRAEGGTWGNTASPAAAPQQKPQGGSGASFQTARAMKELGLKAGGMVKKCVTGGKIAGPGGPTDDLIPIMASNGEFMIKASSAKVLGEDVLEALNDLGDEPKNKKDDAAEDAKEGEMKTGGKVKRMAIGGLVDENQVQVPTGDGMDRAGFLAGGMVRKPVLHMEKGGGVDEELNKRLAQIPGSGTAPAPDGLSMGNDFSRNVSNTLMALPGASGALSGGAQLASIVPSIAKGSATAAGVATKGLGIAPYAAPVAGFSALQAASTPPTQIARAPTSAPATPAVAPAAAQAASVKALSAALAARQGDPSSSDLNDEFSNAAIQTRNPGGQVMKIKQANGTTEYRGGNVTGDISLTDANGNALPGRPGGGVSVIGGMTRAQAQAPGAVNDGGGYAAPEPAMSPLRARLESLGAQSGKLYINQAKVLAQLQGQDRQNDASMASTAAGRQNNAASNAASERNNKAQLASQDRRYADSNAIEQEKLGMSRGEYNMKMQAAQQLKDAQSEYLAAADGSPEQKAAERKLIVLGGKQQSAVRAFAVPGGQGFNADGTPYTMPSTVFDPDTKQFIQQGEAQGAQPASLPPKDKLVKGQAYSTPRGNAVWDGQQFTPV